MRRNIVKKTVSLLVAIMLFAGIFFGSVVAFAENTDGDTDTEEEVEISFNSDVYDALNLEISKNHALTEEYRLPTEWLKDETIVASVFTNIVYKLDDSREVTFTSEDGAITEIVLSDGTLTVTYTVDSESRTATLTNADYDASAENPLLGTWSDSQGSSVVFAAGTDSDVTASGTIKYVPSDETAEAEDITVELTEVALGDVDEYSLTSDSNIVRVQYLETGDDYKDEDNWNFADVDADIDVSTSGWWMFRYVVCKSSSAKTTILAQSDNVSVYFYDNSKPVIDGTYGGLSEAMHTTMEDGVQVGKTYTIRTSLSSVTDSSSYTVYYTLYRWVDNDWLAIFDNEADDKYLVEGYEDYVSSSGVITFKEEDVLADNAPIYKIVYRVTDNYDFTTTLNADGENIEMTIFAVEAEDEIDSMEILSYVLYAVAALALIGIVVVLCIRPKKSDSAAASSDNNDR